MNKNLLILTPKVPIKLYLNIANTLYIFKKNCFYIK